MANILVTGGAGFVGSHLVDTLIAAGHRVRIYDNLEPQVHGQQSPPYLNERAELITGDMRNRDALRCALDGIEVVYHQAAAVGVGQSMYEIERYVSANTLGGAVLLNLLVNERDLLKVQKVVVASSMSIYGEGAYRCPECGIFYPRLRLEEQLAKHEWEMRCPNGHGGAEPLATNEEKPLYPTSIYAITKRDHEEMFLCVGRAYGLPTVALRYFNIYGPRQALTNPYTGVAAIFSGQLLSGQAPLIFEDGNQLRDFVHVSDIVQANLLAMERPEANYEVFNVGTGRPVSIRRVAETLIQQLNPSLQPTITGRYRAGDIRHCYADISKAQRLLGYAPRIAFEDGIRDLLDWVRRQQVGAEHSARVSKMQQELDARGLTR
jgi:dTDP-L-rhamnose 4-epimerase